eukprot:2465967-Rhodomonas_salina.1
MLEGLLLQLQSQQADLNSQWFIPSKDTKEAERRIEQQRSVFRLHNQYYPVSCYDSMTANLLRANDIIVASGGYVEEAAVYAECIGLNPSLPWKKYGLDFFPSDSDRSSILLSDPRWRN